MSLRERLLDKAPGSEQEVFHMIVPLRSHISDKLWPLVYVYFLAALEHNIEVNPPRTRLYFRIGSPRCTLCSFCGSQYWAAVSPVGERSMFETSPLKCVTGLIISKLLYYKITIVSVTPTHSNHDPRQPRVMGNSGLTDQTWHHYNKQRVYR